MKTLVMIVMFCITGCSIEPINHGTVNFLCTKTVDKQDHLHLTCDKKRYIGFGYKF